MIDLPGVGAALSAEIPRARPRERGESVWAAMSTEKFCDRPRDCGEKLIDWSIS